MGIHDRYGKQIMRLSAPESFVDFGWVDYGAGYGARIDGAIGQLAAVEIESRTGKQIRGAVLDLLNHDFSKKLLILIPTVAVGNVNAEAQKCRFILSKYLPENDFRVVVLKGTGHNPKTEEDVLLVRESLTEMLGRLQGLA